MNRTRATVGTKRILRTVAAAIVVVLLANEAIQFSAAWFRIFLATRDAKTAVSEVVQDDPNNRARSAAAAQTACTHVGVDLATYDQSITETGMGHEVRTEIHLSTVAKGALLVPLVSAIAKDGTPSTWRLHKPVVRFGYVEKFATYR